MDKKSIQEQRMRSYFLDAAREIIRGEGTGAVSARSVADRAGYSYATLYNYFKDIRDLIFSCAEDFMEECREFIQKGRKEKPRGAEGITAATSAYAQYFIQYPGAFELLYQQKPSDIATPGSSLEAVNAFFDSLMGDDWELYRTRKKLSETALSRVRGVHRHAVHGLLSLYLNRRKLASYREFMEELKAVSTFLLR